jgi:hypothetical protein
MNSTPLRVVGKALGTWLIILLFVSFLTFTFNFLGTILCAVVIGMMMGASRHAKWQIVPVSLIFPAVVFFMLRWVKTGLASDQVRTVSILCFAAFWLTFALTALLRLVEKSQSPSDAIKSHSLARGNSTLALSGPAPVRGSLDPVSLAVAPAAVPLSLALLQGRWAEASTAPDISRRKLEIINEQIAVRGFSSDGHLDWEAQGRLKVETTEAFKRLISSNGAANSDSMVSI